jgi:hypothetical protein
MQGYDTTEPRVSEYTFREWLINFYESRLDYYMGNVGKRTEFDTLITPALISTTLKRLKQLVDKYGITSGRLL